MNACFGRIAGFRRRAGTGGIAGLQSRSRTRGIRPKRLLLQTGTMGSNFFPLGTEENVSRRRGAFAPLAFLPGEAFPIRLVTDDWAVALPAQ
jgi:hypothetical protein